MKLLVVCLGNICRSPTVEVVLRDVAAREAPALGLEVDSAGTGDYHIGDPPDPRAIAAGARRGYDLSKLRARQVTPGDFSRFDLLLAMDQQNLVNLRAIAPPARAERAQLFLSFHPEAGLLEVPDPYFGGPEGFEQVLDLAESGSRALLAAIAGGRLGLDRDGRRQR
jgi:protein-tyrosine phosphatase